MKIEAKNLGDFISRLGIVSARSTNKSIKPVGKILKRYPDGCGISYIIGYVFKYKIARINEDLFVVLEEHIRIEHDDKETPEECINSKLTYIQDQIETKKSH